jgi:hypothetical protein
MTTLKYKILCTLCLLGIGLGIKAQSFSYTYIDPCTKEVKSINVSDLNGNLPIVMNYYGQVKTFTPADLQNGTFDAWANDVYNNYGVGNPCAQVGVQTITTNVLNVSNSVVNNVVSLSSMLTSITDVASNTASTAASTATNSVSGVANSVSGGSAATGSSSSSGSSEGNNTSKPEEKKTEEQKQEEAKQEEQKQSSSSAKSTSKATAKQDKPAIMLTGDIVGMQRAADAAQDAKLTTSFIKITGDKKRSLGVAIDFTVNARVGNISVFKSWITQKTVRKHIDLVSNSVSILPNSFSNTLVFIRIDNVKKVTGLYGVGAMYGVLNKEPLTTLVAIGGGMYKGQVTKNIDAVFILAAVYVPYMKYYTESIFQTKPLLLPFLNVNYKLTKAFRFGLTGGTTYSVTEQLVNYQILFGAKLTL